MGNIKIKRGSGVPSGLTFGELAFDITNKKLYIGLTAGAEQLTSPQGGVASFNGLTGAVSGVSSLNTYTNNITIGYGSGITASMASMDEEGNVSWTISNSGVLSFNGSNGAVTGVTTGTANTFGPLQSFSSGISAAGSTFSSTTNTLDVIASTDGAGLRIAQATTGAASRIGGIRLGRNALDSSLNTYLESSSGIFTIYNGVGATGSKIVDFTATTTGFSGAVSATGLISSTVGFSGAATNLTGNASGLTAGTASKVQIAEAASASYYLALAGGVGNTGIFVDTTVPRWSYNTSSGALTTTTGSVEAASLIATSTGMFSNTWEGFDGTTPMKIRGPYFDGTFQSIAIGDVYGDAGGTIITIDDAQGFIEFAAFDIAAYGNLNLKGSTPLAFYNATNSNYVAFKGSTGITVNTTWTLPSVDGSSNQVLTTNGSGILSWSTPSGGGGSSVTSFNGFTGGVTLAAGTGITFTASSGTITLSTTGSGGGISRSITSITGSTTAGSAASTDYVYIGGSTGSINLTMPTAVSNTNRYTVKQSNTGTLTILTTSSQTIDGVTGFALNRQYQAVDLISNNSNWIVV